MIGCGASSHGAKRGAPQRSRLVVIVMENKEYDEVIGSSNAPYINRLARSGALATSSHAVAHPSLANYLALTGGSTFGIDSDCTTCQVKGRNLVDQLETTRTSWKAYMEEMPSACFSGSSSGSYLKRHNPFVYYDTVTSNRRRCRKVVPFAELDRDIRHHRLPSFTWITPDACNDMHDCSVATGDRWLSQVVPRLLPLLGPSGAIVLTWDEGASHEGCCRVADGGRIPTVFAGPAVRSGTRSAAAFDHYSVLRMIDQAIGARPLRLAGCRCTPRISGLFARRPSLH